MTKSKTNKPMENNMTSRFNQEEERILLNQQISNTKERK